MPIWLIEQRYYIPVFALFSTASHTRCVSSASRNVGGHGLPLPNASRKSATWWVKECS